jgi:hypothetical protein
LKGVGEGGGGGEEKGCDEQNVGAQGHFSLLKTGSGFELSGRSFDGIVVLFRATTPRWGYLFRSGQNLIESRGI